MCKGLCSCWILFLIGQSCVPFEFDISEIKWVKDVSSISAIPLKGTGVISSSCLFPAMWGKGGMDWGGDDWSWGKGGMGWGGDDWSWGKGKGTAGAFSYGKASPTPTAAVTPYSKPEQPGDCVSFFGVGCWTFFLTVFDVCSSVFVACFGWFWTNSWPRLERHMFQEVVLPLVTTAVITGAVAGVTVVTTGEAAWIWLPWWPWWWWWEVVAMEKVVVNPWSLGIPSAWLPAKTHIFVV